MSIILQENCLKINMMLERIMDYYSAIKKVIILPFAAWIHLEIITLS